MDVFLAGSDSLKLTRIARRDPELALIPAGDAHKHAHSSPVDLTALRIALPQEMSTFSPTEPLGLTFFSRGTRCTARCISSRALLTNLPTNAFFEVVHADGSPWLYDGDPGLRLFVESPGLSLVRMEQLLKTEKNPALQGKLCFLLWKQYESKGDKTHAKQYRRRFEELTKQNTSQQPTA